MFKVTAAGPGYRISIGDGKPAKARDTEAIVLAVRHYFDGGHGQEGRKKNPWCPFCQQLGLVS